MIPLRFLFVLALAAGTPPQAKASGPTFCMEWVRQSNEGYERFTLFADRTLVWKTSRKGSDQVRRKLLEPDELQFYCSYFGGAEFWDLPEDLRSGLGGDFAMQSAITLTRPDGSRRKIRFDDLSALPSDAASLRSSLEGLKGIFTSPIAPASRFTPETLPAGTLLKRFDGVLFRVRRVESEKGIVELEAVWEPYFEFKKIEELRFQFSPPE